ncbi:PadR family transcriptional regulator [Nitrospirillum iridis]|uniref:DNA-binding PadR family transcriptional regulator n=1 Tax=Nitrospirillum iridis TaxID=765888 RepID=A0A7X0EG14_9PROT|nr:PadR family transcriptional regulator [Nitrospirillum iridis]MBB6253651.1 DNA-binding PadR family transcriptional regulator [Nitrospirillum iridis]
MSLPHALLTALLERPCSGSELAGRFDRSIGFFWQATHQQIYRELKRLEELGWITALAPEAGRGRKRAYEVRPAGREELRRWTGEVHEPKPLRDELMVRLRAEAVIGPTDLVRDIESRLALHQDKLALYREIEGRDFAEGVPTRQRELHHLVLQAGIMAETLWVDFCRKAIGVLVADDAAKGKP